jgi:hypothetical protein
MAGWTFDRFRVWFETQIKKLNAETTMAERANDLMEQQLKASQAVRVRVESGDPRLRGRAN